MSETETARYARERAFHDGRYANDDRAANRFYEIDASSIAHYLARLERFAPDGRVLEYGCGDGADTAVHLARAGARPARGGPLGGRRSSTPASARPRSAWRTGSSSPS